MKEIPLLFARKPFAVISYDQLHIKDVGNLIDEDICHALNLPLKNFQYSKFTLFPGQISRCVANVKASVQLIEGGKVGKTISFQARVVRDLKAILGTEAISDEALSTKLKEDLPSKPAENVKKRVKNWVKTHQGNSSMAPNTANSSDISETMYPDGTKTMSNCHCSWSSPSSQSRPCCQHRGQCSECANECPNDILEDIPESTIVTETDILEDSEIFDPWSVGTISESNSSDDESEEYRTLYSENQLEFYGDYPKFLNKVLNLSQSKAHNKSKDWMFYPHEQFDNPTSDCDFRRLTGDRLREFHKENWTPFAGEEIDLRQLDKIRKFQKMNNPDQPCVFSHYGNLDIYLNEKWTKLNKKKLAWENLKERRER